MAHLSSPAQRTELYISKPTMMRETHPSPQLSHVMGQGITTITMTSQLSLCPPTEIRPLPSSLMRARVHKSSRNHSYLQHGRALSLPGVDIHHARHGKSPTASSICKSENRRGLRLRAESASWLARGKSLSVSRVLSFSSSGVMMKLFDSCTIDQDRAQVCRDRPACLPPSRLSAGDVVAAHAERWLGQTTFFFLRLCSQ